MSVILSSSELSSAVWRNRSRETLAADRQINDWRACGSAAVTAVLYQPANRGIAFVRSAREGWSLPTVQCNQQPRDDEALRAMFSMAARLGIHPYSITFAVPQASCSSDGHPDKRMPIHGIVCATNDLSARGDPEWAEAAWVPLDSISQHLVPAEATKDNRIIQQFTLPFRRFAAPVQVSSLQAL
jgi:hypothetical protein